MTLFDARNFLRDWLLDLGSEQERAGGIVPLVIPNPLSGYPMPAAAWGDAATVVPWSIWQRFGDSDVLRSQLDSMAAWSDEMLARAGDTGLWEGSLQFGDWLDPDAPASRPDARVRSSHNTVVLSATPRY